MAGTPLTDGTVCDAIGYERLVSKYSRTRIVHIRVTSLAIPGSLVCLPLTKERARAHAKRFDHPNGGVDIVTGEYERYREILMHPLDWYGVLRDPEYRFYFTTTVKAGGVSTRLMGLPVTFD